jgi:hypothetical protein
MLHAYTSQEMSMTNMMLMCVSVDDVVELLEEESSFSSAHYERVERDLRGALQENNKSLMSHLSRKEARNAYIKGAISYEFFGPLLGIDLSTERDGFYSILQQKHHVEKLRAIQFCELGCDEEDGEEDEPKQALMGLESIAANIWKQQFFKYKTPESLRDRVQRVALTEIGKLQLRYSLEQHLLVIGYVLLASVFHVEQDDIHPAYASATARRPEYVFLLPPEFREDDDEDSAD